MTHIFEDKLLEAPIIKRVTEKELFKEFSHGLNKKPGTKLFRTKNDLDPDMFSLFICKTKQKINITKYQEICKLPKKGNRLHFYIQDSC